MQRLTITYGEITVYDGEVDEFTWTDTANTVTVTGKTGRRTGGLLDLLSARRQPAAEQA